VGELNIIIEDLISQKAPDFEIAKAIKKSIKEYLDSLDDIFNDSQGKDFFVKHTKEIDGFVKTMYKYLLRKHFHDFMPLSNTIPITLVALGSYGREQLCVYSDIDIMVLYQEIPAYNLKPIMEELMILAWDSGLKLGSRVHEIKEIEDVAKTDITIKTSLIESRYIYGSKVLWFKLQGALLNIKKFQRREFILEKFNEHKERLLKYPLRMEPNVKDGYGGMRESNLMFWFATVIYGVHNTKELIDQLFDENEYKKYRVALEYIFRVRNALHLIAKKKLDQVNFDVLPELSNKLGFKDTAKLVKERQCMSKLFESLHIIHSFCSVMTKKIASRYLYDSNNLKVIKESRIKKNIYLHEKRLYSSFHRKPITLLKLLKEINELPKEIEKFDNSYVHFAKKTRLPKILSSTTKQQVRILFENPNLYPILNMLYKSGLFVKILPSVKKIINQPQFDGFHVHPVDIHTLKALHHAHNIKDSFVFDIYNKLDTRQKGLLNLIVLFHDIGKGRTKDHHVVSEDLFKKFAKSFAYNEEDIKVCARIIRYHNMLTHVATKEDIYSQKVIIHFNGLIGSIEALNLLTCITYGDINSVASNVYKSSTAALIKELYLQSYIAFDNIELIDEGARRVKKENTIKNNKVFKELPHRMQKKILNIESNQIFLTKKASDIIELGVRAKDVTTKEYEISNDDVLRIKIIRTIPLNLGYLLGKMNFIGLAGMTIYKLYDEKKYFEMWFTSGVEEDEIEYIKEIVENSFDMSKEISLKKPLIERDEISIDCEHREDVALLKIETKDQKGLFAYIAKVFDDFNIDIESAKIYTARNKVNDLLLIQKNGNFCDIQEKVLELITN
jgi:[protein-PII] uridylyltransferase